MNCPPIMGRNIAARTPGAQLVVMPDAGHLILFEHAERVLGATKN